MYVVTVRPLAGSFATAATFILPASPSTQLWSYPWAVVSWLPNGIVALRMLSPIACMVRKSNGVPATGANWPVGIRFASVGVNVLAGIFRSWP